MTSSSSSWPPPPDLASLEELLTNADIEGFIADGGHPDEYEGEAEQLLAAIGSWPTKDLTSERVLTQLEIVWAQAFGLDDGGLANRRVKLRELASQVARFFGPDAQPQVRGA